MGGGEEGEGGDAVLGSQAEAKRRKERVERDEFIRKCRVSLHTHTCIYMHAA